MPTVYLVTSGEYSDYGVDGVFSSRLLAEEFSKKVEGSRIETWELDERSGDEVCTYWSALLDLATGSLGPANEGFDLQDPKLRVGTVKHANYVSQAHDLGYILSKSYVSQEHANKICVEKRQEIQRQGGAQC